MAGTVKESGGGRVGVVIPTLPKELFTESHSPDSFSKCSSSKKEFRENIMPKQPFYLLFQTEKRTPVYFSAKRYPTKTEIKEIEKLYGLQFKCCVIPAERMLEFSLCRQFEEAIEQFITN